MALSSTMLRPNPSIGSAWSGSTCSCSSVPVATSPLATRALSRRNSSYVQSSRGSALLERADRIEEVQPAGYDIYTDRDWTKEFAEYTRATQQLEELASLQAELMDSVQTMDSLLLAPEQPQGTDTPEARRAKRQQARAARKAPDASTSNTAAAASLTLDVQPTVRVRNVPLPVSPVAQPPLLPPQKVKRTALMPSLAPADSQPAVALQVSQPSSLALPSSSSSTSNTSLSIARPSAQGWAAPTTLALSSGPSLSAPSAGTARGKHQARASRNSSKRVITTDAMAAELTSGKSSSASGVDGTSQFMKSAASTALLKPEQQKEVAAVVKDFLMLKSMEKELKVILKRPPTIAEWAKAAKATNPILFQARLKAGQDAKALMLKSNYRLVIKVVKAYQNRGLSLQDLIAEGMQGLLRGVEKFEVDKGFRFSTYAHWWIRQAVTRALQEQGRTVRLPTHLHEQITRITMAKQSLLKKLGRAPTMGEISEAVSIPAEKIPEILAAASQVNSLDTPVAGDDEGGLELKDTLADDRSQPDEVFADDMIRENMNEVLNSLSPREAGVLRMHWGLDGHPEMTLEEIGAHFKITRERVRQLEARAMRILKDHQKKLQGVMHELQDIPLYEQSAEGRASRGTKKT